MTIQYADNFSFYGTDVNNLLQTAWASLSSGSLANDPDGVSSGKVLRTSVSATGVFATRVVVPTPRDKIGVAFRTWVSSLPSTNGRGAAVSFKSSGNNHRATLHITPTGQLRLVNTVGEGTGLDELDTADIGTEVAVTGPLVVGAGQWNHIEFVYDASDGTYEVRVEGVQVLSGTDSGFNSDDIGNIEFLDKFNSTSSGEPANYIKDLVVWDAEGSQNNDFVGAVRVIALPVNADVSSGWTRSAGATDYELLDELDPNDTDYIEADETPPAPSVMEFEDLPVEIIGVRALMSVVRNLKTDGGDATLQVSLRYNSADDNGADRAVQASASYSWDVSELNPDTGQLWAPTEVDAAQIVIDRTS